MGTLRTLLALAVALSHGGGVFGYTFIDGTVAVQIFYVISGFLISHILLTKYEATPRGNWLFYSNRALRIFVPYWTVLIATAVVAAVIYTTQGWRFGAFSMFADYEGQMTVGTKAFLAFTNLFIFGQDVALWLKLQQGSLYFAWEALKEPPVVAYFNVLTPAWTIALELMFYALAPFLVRRSVWLIALIVVVSTALRFISYRYGYYTSATGYRFFPFELGLFLAGTLSYRLYQGLQRRRLLNFYLTATVTAMTVAFALGYSYFPKLGNYPNQYCVFFASALLMPLLFDFATRVRPDRWIGELSYPIYLIHWPVQYVVLTSFAWLGVGQWATLLSLSLTVLLSVALVVFVTTPLDRWRETRTRKQPSESSSVMTRFVSRA